MPPTEFTDEAEVVIVGSGPTGATYARLVTEACPSARVLLVEAGPAVTDPPGLHMTCVADPEERERARVACQGPHQYRYALSAVSGTAHTAARQERERALSKRAGLFPVGGEGGGGLPAAQAACNVGGMGSHWFGACPRPGESERTDCVPPGTLDEALAVAETLLGVSSTQFAGSAFASHLERVLAKDLDEGRAPDRTVRPMPMAVTRTADGVRRAGPDVVLGELLTRPDGHFALRPDTLCEKVVVSGGRVRGVRLRERATGRVTAVRAPYVVVAADPLRTPQLLHASGVRPPALGRHLNEHAQVSLLAEVAGVGHGEQGADAAAMSEPTAASVARSGVTWIPHDGDRYPLHGMLVQIDPDSVPHLAGAHRPRRPLVSVHFYTAQEPRFANRVEFSDTEQDWLGMPAMTIHHTPGTRDREVLAFAEAEAIRLAGLLGGPADGERPWTLPSGSSLHYQGTVRMGAVDEGTSVCDPTCRVWGVDNLYVAGNGVIPTPTACNPTLTSVAFAVIGARDIARRLGAGLDGAGHDAARPAGRAAAPEGRDCRSSAFRQAGAARSTATREDVSSDAAAYWWSRGRARAWRRRAPHSAGPYRPTRQQAGTRHGELRRPGGGTGGAPAAGPRPGTGDQPLRHGQHLRLAGAQGIHRGSHWPVVRGPPRTSRPGGAGHQGRRPHG